MSSLCYNDNLKNPVAYKQDVHDMYEIINIYFIIAIFPHNSMALNDLISTLQ